MLYHRMVLEPHTAHSIPVGTRYILLTVQKTLFGLDIIPETILPQLMENGFKMGDFRKIKRYDQKFYKLPPPDPAHVPAETNKRPLEEQPGTSSKRPFTALATPQTVSIQKPPVLTTTQILLADPPVQIPVFQPPVQIPPVRTTPHVQLFLPDPPPLHILLLPVVETLGPTLTDDS
ncbi:uncharacterized protein TNCV_4569691 [Trichonephila clavipes]|nr:uncharacterized protein TNCV_4569691 [Trichonephila clavipes]